MRSRPLVQAVLVLGLALGAITGCGGSGGSNTSCDLTGCSITFPRDGTPEVSVLGITARLIEVQGDTATVEVAGQRVAVPVGGQAESDGFTVRVERATDTEVVVRVSPGGGG